MLIRGILEHNWNQSLFHTGPVFWRKFSILLTTHFGLWWLHEATQRLLLHLTSDTRRATAYKPIAIILPILPTTRPIVERAWNCCLLFTFIIIQLTELINNKNDANRQVCGGQL